MPKVKLTKRPPATPARHSPALSPLGEAMLITLRSSGGRLPSRELMVRTDSFLAAQDAEPATPPEHAATITLLDSLGLAFKVRHPNGAIDVSLSADQSDPVLPFDGAD